MKARAIVALDVPTAADALELLSALGDGCGFFKIGNELFTAAGPGDRPRMRDARRDVFLDLKFHDIPNTVAARRAPLRPVRGLVTVHASGGRAMLEAAVEGAGTACGVLAVTVLTSLDGAALGQAWGRSISRVEDEVLRLAELARDGGSARDRLQRRGGGAVRAKFGDTLGC